MSAASRPQPYLIVDGHSMVFAWEDVRALHGRSQAAGRELLIQKLRHYQDASAERVVLVFDGRGARTSSERANPDDIQILYSGDGHTADAVIERLVAKYAETYPITVATSDRLEQLTAHSFGALCIDAEMLRERMLRAEKETSKIIRKLNRRL